MGRGRGCLHGPPSLLCLYPCTLEPWRGEMDSSQAGIHLVPTCKATRTQVHGIEACGPQLSQIWLRVAWVPGEQHLGDRTAFPQKRTHLPCPALPCPSSEVLQTVIQQRHGWLLTWSSLQPAILDPYTWECRAFSACVRVAVYMYLYVCRSLKSNLVNGAPGLCMLE